MFAIPGMGILSVIWPVVRSFLMMVIRPFLDPMNWIGLIFVGGIIYGYAYFKGAHHSDRKWEARIQRDKDEQNRTIKAAGEESDRWQDLFAKEKEKTNELTTKLDAEAAADVNAGRKCFTPDSVRRMNQVRRKS
jgi:hypothetical protein